MTLETQLSGADGFIESMRNRESLSGPGSTLAATTEIREWLPAIIDRYSIWHIADVPCGDWTWMSAVDLRGAAYRGYDVSQEVVDANGAKYPHAFEKLNAIAAKIPAYADLIICRDFLVHLTYEHAKAVLENFRASGAEYLAVTTFPGQANGELQEWSDGWGWRPLDMEAEPFNLPPAIDGVKECFFGDKWNRWTKLYRISQ